MGDRVLTHKEESFAKAFVLHKNEPIEGYRNSEYSQRLTAEDMSKQAQKLLNKPHINRRIGELQAKASAIAEKKFTITVEQRLRWLSDIVESGLSEYTDAQENKRKENLAAARGAIETLNTMLGINEDGEDTVKPIPIGVVDAS